MRVVLLILSMTILFGCNPREESTDRSQAKQTEAMVRAANQSVGMPNISNFTEKRFAKLIYELKDQEVTTYSYFMDMNGGLHFLCESVGYGMPSSVQYVNPSRHLNDGSRSSGKGNTVLPQSEPNGLFMPEGLAATFVLCTDGEGGVRPIYSEPELIVSPFKLKTVASLQ